jgi:hypothetical protein
VTTDAKAQEILQGKANGFFIARPCNEPGKIVLSFVSNSAVSHHKVPVDDNGFHYNNQAYSTLVDLLKANSQVFKNPLYK